LKFTSWLVFFSGGPFFSICPSSALVTSSTFLILDGLDLGFSILGPHLVGISGLSLILSTTLATTLTTTFCSSSFLGTIAGNVTLFFTAETVAVRILLPFIGSCSLGSSSRLYF